MRVEFVLRGLQSKIGGKTVRGIETDTDMWKDHVLGSSYVTRFGVPNLKIFIENRQRGVGDQKFRVSGPC